MYSKFTPTCIGKWLPSAGGRRCLRSYSSSVCVVGVYGLRSVYAHNTHFPKHVGVNLEYINKIHWFLDAFCWSFTTIHATCFGHCWPSSSVKYVTFKTQNKMDINRTGEITLTVRLPRFSFQWKFTQLKLSYTKLAIWNSIVKSHPSPHEPRTVWPSAKVYSAMVTEVSIYHFLGSKKVVW
jgi:hypothetical protein